MKVIVLLFCHCCVAGCFVYVYYYIQIVGMREKE